MPRRLPQKKGSEEVKSRKVRTNKGNIDTAFSQRPALRGPSQSVLQNPRIEIILRLLRKAEVGGGDALKDVVVVLCRPEDGWRRVGNVPEQRTQERKRISTPIQSRRSFKALQAQA